MSSELYEAWLCALDKTIPSNLERRKQMEEIKLPKFKTKEELEDFAKGQAQEIEALKSVIKAKDRTIGEQEKTIDQQYGELAGKGLLLGSIDKLSYDNKKLEEENKELKKKCDNIDYKEKYERATKELEEYEDYYSNRRIKDRDDAEKIEYLDNELKCGKENIKKLCCMILFLIGMLPSWKLKRFKNNWGVFNVKDYI